MDHNQNGNRKIYWSSLAEYRQEPEFLQRREEEFYSKPQAFFEAAEEGKEFELTRRDLLKLGGTALVFAAASCARRPIEKIVPYLNAPEQIVPGRPTWYASTCGRCAAGCGILVKTREGRPIKLEGNPSHPLNKGRLCARGQAAVRDLYDPDRAKYPLKVFRSQTEPAKIDWATADSEAAYALGTVKGKVVLLTGTIHGLARQRLIKEFLGAFPGSQHVIYDALSEEETLKAQQICYGSPVLPRYRFDQAEVLVLLGSDPLAGSHSVTEFAQGFGLQRKIRDKSMSKVISFEPALSLTGSNADEHYLVKPEDLLKVALGLANQLIVQDRRSDLAGDALVRNILKDFEPAKIEKEIGLPEGTVKATAEKLWQGRGKGLVYGAGLASRSESALSLHIMTNLLNTILGNDGKTVDYGISPSNQSAGSVTEMFSLIVEMQAGKVDVLLIYGTNPAYSLPESAGFKEALKNVKTVVSLNDRLDETSVLADYLLPSLHFLESWGDAEPQKGLYSLFQPTISNLHDNRSFEGSLLALAKKANAGKLGSKQVSWHDYLKESWYQEIYQEHRILADFEEFWNSALREGAFDTVERAKDSLPPRKFRTDALKSFELPKAKVSELSLALYAPAMQYDGRANNNAWLLETPDPVSKITWENFVAIAPQTAERLGLQEGQIVKLASGDFSSEIPVHIQPGVHPEVLSVAVGWGREKTGRTGNKVGVNAFKWASIKGDKLRFSALPVRLEKTEKITRLASVQDHNNILQRPIIYEATLEEYKENPGAGRIGEEKLTSMWPEHKYESYKWGMAIDLNSCIGCNACMLACQAENNVPVVGKVQVAKGREMSWIRIDRYYSGQPENPGVVYQPMLCQQCENAPCETVCPVVATLHNEEGLNLQIYNRCVGTRYCSNNCPYKVRRFNWYENNQDLATPLDLVLNPDVTVREKGVMEKCTFCIQRIRFAKEEAKKEGRKVRDGEFQTACQQTCPTEAIVFGDLNDPESKVSKLARQERGYHVLEILNTRPSITYLTKIRNREKTEKA
jgi:molybdopterin-containing oxidoreductase family iron-sulfur binding subunit